MKISIELMKAQVIDDSDPNKTSRIKIKILPEFKDIPTSDLPWASPHAGLGMLGTEFSHNPPVKNSFVWVYDIDGFYQEFRYISGQWIEGLFDYTKGSTPAGNISEKTSSFTYPDPRFFLLPDGSVLFYSSNGDKGIINSDGSYMFQKASGAHYLNAKANEVKVYNNSGSILLASNGQVNINNGNFTVDP